MGAGVTQTEEVIYEGFVWSVNHWASTPSELQVVTLKELEEAGDPY